MTVNLKKKNDEINKINLISHKMIISHSHKQNLQLLFETTHFEILF